MAVLEVGHDDQFGHYVASILQSVERVLEIH